MSKSSSAMDSKLDKVDKTTSQSSLFVSMALDMSWRLALVVLVPIIGGFELDKKLDTTPLLSIVGFGLAMIGTGLIMWQTMQTANKLPVPKATKRGKKS